MTISLDRMFATTLITALFVTTPSLAQDSQSGKGGVETLVEKKKEAPQVEVETDKFSGKTTVKLKPQVLLDTPEHKLVMTLSGQGSVLGISFESISQNFISFGDR